MNLKIRLQKLIAKIPEPVEEYKGAKCIINGIPDNGMTLEELEKYDATFKRKPYHFIINGVIEDVE